MSKGSESMSTMFAQAGLPPEVNAALPALLRRAGYDTDDERELMLGMTALVSALRVYEEFERGPQKSSPGASVGRNDPCPCGSGKKYKKCCLRKAERETRAPGFVPRLPLEDSELIPRLHDMPSLAADLGSLGSLFHEDAELKKIRFSRRKVADFLQDAAGGEDPGESSADPDDANAKRDALVLRYLGEVEGVEVLGDIGDALLKAGRRWAKNSENVRALATGLCLADLTDPEATPSDAVNPLVSMLFWASLQEYLEANEKVHDLIQRMGGAESLRQRVLDGEPLPFSELEAAMEGVDLGSVEAIRGETENAFDAIRKKVREGDFPVGLPLASVLPTFVRMAFVDPENQPPEKQVIDMVLTSVHGLGPEDLRLLDDALSQWAQASPGDEHEETRGDIGMIRTLIARGSLDPLDLDFVLAGLRFSRMSIIGGEPGFAGNESSTMKEKLSPDWLERYGDFLMENGYPDMARRTWRLCELHGPLPASVEEKLRDAGAGDK